MNKAINMPPEALELVNKFCDVDTLEDHIGSLEVAEDTLQELAYMERDSDQSSNIFSVAYNIKSIRKDMIKLKTLLENG